MSTALDLSAIDPSLRVDGHLPECPTGQPTDRADRADDVCDWCLWAIDGAGVRNVVDAIGDTRALLADYDRRNGEVSVPWVVASSELLHAPRPLPQGALVPSTGELLARLHQVLHDGAGPLARRMDAAVAAGGPVERRCLISAGPLAAAALQRPEHATLLDQLPNAARKALGRVAGLLSADNQTAGLLPMVEAQHGDGVPVLRTQPAWARRSNPTDASHNGPASTISAPTSAAQRSGAVNRCGHASRPTSRAAPRSGAGPAAGSFEALVVESVIDTVTDQIEQVAGELADALPRTTLQLPRDRRVLSERTRLLTWRIARIDWHLTFVDTGRADCWQANADSSPSTTPRDARSHDGATTAGAGILVPWTVALAIDECERAGLVSATHQSPEHTRP